LLAPFFTFNGGGFECGGATTDGGRRTPHSYQENVRLGHRIITEKNPKITALDWVDCLEAEQLGEDDFVFVDGPYIEANVGPYKPDSIVPTELIEYLQHAPFCWVLCESRQPIYIAGLGEPVLETDVQQRAKPGDTERRVECVWVGGAKTSNRCTATVGQIDYRSLTTEQLLAELAASYKDITASINQTSAHIRRKMLPLACLIHQSCERCDQGVGG